MMTQIKLIISGIILIAIVMLIVMFAKHERDVEDQHLQKASDQVQKRADEGTETNIVKAAIAARGAEDDQRAIAAYIAAHPVQPVRVCHSDASGSRLPETGGALTPTAGAGTGPAAVSKVLGGSQDVDVGPAVDTILRATEALDVLYRERQRR